MFKSNCPPDGYLSPFHICIKSPLISLIFCTNYQMAFVACLQHIHLSKQKKKKKIIYFFLVTQYKWLLKLDISSVHYDKKNVSIYLSIHMNNPTRALLQLDSLTSLWYLVIISACFLSETLFYCWAITNKPCMADYATALTITSWPFSILFVKIFISHVESY